MQDQIDRLLLDIPNRAYVIVAELRDRWQELQDSKRADNRTLPENMA
jgi:hypothetical protein